MIREFDNITPEKIKELIAISQSKPNCIFGGGLLHERRTLSERIRDKIRDGNIKVHNFEYWRRPNGKLDG